MIPAAARAVNECVRYIILERADGRVIGDYSLSVVYNLRNSIEGHARQRAMARFCGAWGKWLRDDRRADCPKFAISARI